MFASNNSIGRRRRTQARALGALATAAAVALVATACSGGGHSSAQPPRPRATTSTTHVTTTTRPEPILRAIPLVSTYETADRSVSRDGGISVALPDGRALWLFGDTGIFDRAAGGPWNSTTFIDGSTAMIARFTPGVVPTGSELPFAEPARFLPTPDDVFLPDGSGQHCNYDTAAFGARWPIGAALFDATNVIVTYSIVCVTRPNGIPTTQAEGWGYVLYNWQTGRFTQGPTDVFAPPTSGAAFSPSYVFVSPIVSAGEITFYASECTTRVVACAAGAAYSTTMPATVAAISNPASYRPTPLRTDGTSTFAPLSVSVGKYADGLRLLELADIAGTYKLFTAPKVGAPWHLDKTGTLPGCPTQTGFCLALEGHPELSSATRTFVSYKDADAQPGGHIVISSLPT